MLAANRKRIPLYGILRLRIPRSSAIIQMTYLFCSHVWLPTVQDVLHADWQDVWHSPHPPFFKLLFMVCVFNVFTCFMVMILLIFA